MTAIVLVRDTEPASTWRSRADAASEDLALLQGANALFLLLFVVGLVALGLWASSRPMESRGPLNRLGRTGLWISLLGFATCGLAAPVGLVLSALGLWRSPRRGAAVGVLVGSLGTAWLVAGVGLTRESARLQILADDAEEESFPRGDLATYHARSLFLQDSPYRSIHIEVDWMEGFEPEQEVLMDLSRFLAMHCRKPDGIEVRKSTEIPAEEASIASLNRLALAHMDGPPPSADDSVPAFLYVLYHDGRVQERPSDEAGFVELGLYPAAIFVDTSALAGPAKGVSSDVLRGIEADVLAHEAAHVLGLAPVEHGNGIHCGDPSCLLFPRITTEGAWYSPLPGVRFTWSRSARRRDLCRRCLDLLSEIRASQTPPVRFDGPVLIREEGRYRVVSLPGWLQVLGSAEEEVAWSSILERARAKSRKDGLAPDEAVLSLFTSESTQEGLDTLFDAVLEDPQPCVAHLATRVRARTLWQAGHRQRALDEIRVARDWFAEESWPDETLAHFEAERGDYHAALDAIEGALEIDPENAGAHRLRGSFLDRLGRPEDAIAAMDAALGLEPNDLHTLHDKIGLLVDLERFDEALDTAEEAARVDPELAWPHVHRGLVLHRLRRFEEAISAYDRALELEPDDEAARKRRQEAERARDAAEPEPPSR